MSSVIRTFPPRNQGLTRFLKPESPCYQDSGLPPLSIVPLEYQTVLFPFSYYNGTLDISYSGNTFETDMVATTGNAPLDESDLAVQLMSGPRLVTSLGDNFKAYIRSWRNATIDAGSPINIYINPQVVKVQEVQRANITASSSDSYRISTESPASDTYPTGAISNNYQTKYVFKTPLTFTIFESGVLTYITFRTAFDQE
jgi:hypothetical protein